MSEYCSYYNLYRFFWSQTQRSRFCVSLPKEEMRSNDPHWDFTKKKENGGEREIDMHGMGSGCIIRTEQSRTEQNSPRGRDGAKNWASKLRMQYTLIHTHARKQATAISTQKYRLKRETTTTTTSKGNRMPVCIPYVYNVMCSSIGRPFAISGSSNWTEQFCLNNSWDSFLVSVLICSFDAFASLPFKLRLWLSLSRSFPTIASLQTIKRKGDNTPCTSINHLANKFSSIKCTLTQALNETYEATKTEIKSSNKKQDVNNICDSLSSPKSNYSRVRMHISLTERWFVHPFCPTKCPFAFIQNTPTLGWHGHNFQFYACIFGFACMHPNNDRPISTRIYADRQQKKKTFVSSNTIE